jgi:capsular polysaccharide biosynthesis protein
LILACVISILLELIDTTIKPDEDLSEIYKVPVFAEIPDFET